MGFVVDGKRSGSIWIVTPPEMNSSDALGGPDQFSLNLSLTQPPEKSSYAESPVVQGSTDDDFVP